MEMMKAVERTRSRSKNLASKNKMAERIRKKKSVALDKLKEETIIPKIKPAQIEMKYFTILT